MTAATSSPTIAVFGSSSITAGSAAWRQAHRCGRLLAERGCVVVTGGYGGAMEATSAGAREGGGHVVGITAPSVFPRRTGANASVIEEDPAPNLTERIHRLLTRADGVIALPGRLGTFAELVMAWNLAHVAPLSGVAPPPIAAVGDAWGRLIPLVADAVNARATDIACVTTVDEAVAHVVPTRP